MNNKKSTNHALPDVFKWFFISLIAITLGAFIITYNGLAKHYWISAGILFCILIIVWGLYTYGSWSYTAKFQNVAPTSGSATVAATAPAVPGSMYVQPGTFPDSTQNYFGTKIPIMGPLDGLAPVDVVTRMNYLYEKTSYPYRPLKFTEYETTTDKTLKTQSTSLLTGSLLDTPDNKAEMSRWYPNTTLLQVNARDCTNYAAGDPRSCNMEGQIYQLSAIGSAAPTDAVTAGKLLDNKSAKLAEGFENMNSMPKSLETIHEFPVLFKNSGAQVVEFDAEHLHPVGTSGDMCRTCKVGRCSKALCGSRMFEPGNDNLLDVANYVKDYLADDIPFSGQIAGGMPTPLVQGQLRLARG